MKVIETGIVIQDIRRFPVNQCIGYQAIGHRVANSSKWTSDGFEVLIYCLKDATPNPEILPCFNGAVCVWHNIQKKQGQVIAPIPAAPPAKQLTLDEALTTQEVKS
jgi:hypothetical protein